MRQIVEEEQAILLQIAIAMFTKQMEIKSSNSLPKQNRERISTQPTMMEELKMTWLRSIQSILDQTRSPGAQVGFQPFLPQSGPQR